ncbi:histidine kinase [Paenibacillus filicis]|uniref:Histidine kinase n=1 Tax=Paenibacillus filicis TaxID=669464 RepID=A0ABU9DGE8_9BACL
MRILQTMSLKKKLVLLMAFLYIPLPVIGWIWYEKTNHAIEANAIDSSIQAMNQVNAHLDTYFSEVQRMMLPLLASDLTALFLNREDDDASSRYELSRRIEKELFSSMLVNRKDIYGISLVSESVQAISSSSFTLAEQRYPAYLNRIKSSGRFTIMGVENMPDSQVVGMALTFVSPQNGLKRGMLIVDQKRDEIVRIMQTVQLGKSGFVWMADSANQVIYHPSMKSANATVPEAYLNEMGAHSSGTFTVNTDQGKKLVVYIRSDRTDLTLFSEVLLSELNQSITAISRISMVILAVLFFLSMLSASWIVYSLTHPLLTLQRLMKHAEMGDIRVRAPFHRGQEIGSLFRGFNKMLEEIERLIEIVHVSDLRKKELEVKQKDSLLHAMQAQINPHFLYNTLEFINSNAIIEGNERISNMIGYLGDMFRYNVQNPNSRVFLIDEIRHIEAYLAIQSERYPTLSYRIEVDRAVIASIPAVRSTLQPIVENSFKHGYDRHKLRPGCISIRGELQQDRVYVLDVSDSGRGMPPDTMERYNTAFGQPENDFSDPQSEAGHHSIGLINVHARLRLLFGEPYGLFIVSSDETGTTIRLTFPVHPGHEEDYDGL